LNLREQKGVFINAFDRKGKDNAKPDKRRVYSAEAGAKLCRKHKDPNRKTVFFGAVLSYLLKRRNRDLQLV